MTKIALVDDHEIVRDGIWALLLGQPRCKVIWTADSSNMLWEQIAVSVPDVMLLDIQMPQESGLQLIEPILERYPSVKILMLSANTDEQSLQTAITCGAMGFLSKDCSKRELLEAIESVEKSEPYFSKTLLPAVFKGFVKQSKQPVVEVSPLSEREQTIAQLLAKGVSYKEIGDQLFISPRTVETHRKNILEKLGLDGTPALIQYAARRGWL